VAEADIHSLTALYGFVYDLTNETLLYTHGDQQAERTPASLTKLLTICTALEYLDPATEITAGVETTWIDPLSSVAGVKEGYRLTVEQLVQGMMMKSGNDTAYALAVAAGKAIAGGEEFTQEEYLQVFMNYMNRRAVEQGLKNTFFVTPDGTTAPDHHTTPEDLLRIAKMALKDPLIRQYAACPQAPVTFSGGEELLWVNTNWMLHPESDFYCPDARGLKTGYTSAAGNCMLALFDNGGREMLICVLGCPTTIDRFRDILYLYDHYKNKPAGE
jgi:D-alanyl-D-alanine carboxypeptidase (penicillin-binding protein 5/6)